MFSNYLYVLTNICRLSCKCLSETNILAESPLCIKLNFTLKNCNQLLQNKKHLLIKDKLCQNVPINIVINFHNFFYFYRIPNDWSSSTLLRAFINSIFFDVILVIVSPILLLYSSNELRSSIKTKLTTAFFVVILVILSPILLLYSPNELGNSNKIQIHN